MAHCKNCIHWVDESLDDIEAGRSGGPHVFMGCRMSGVAGAPQDADSCSNYSVSDDLFTICRSCNITVPKVCVSLGECVNCTDTDLFCLDSCIGEESRKYCTHFVRMHTEGVHLIDENDQVFDLYPTLSMPGQAPPKKSD